MTILASIFEIDSSRKKSDWTDIYNMLDDIKQYVAETQDFVSNADDPGYNYTPPRTARIGFVSAKGKEWTIKITDASKKYQDIPKNWGMLKTLLRSSGGRSILLEILNGNRENIEQNR
jgi:hypothetical protein